MFYPLAILVKLVLVLAILPALAQGAVQTFQELLAAWGQLAIVAGLLALPAVLVVLLGLPIWVFMPQRVFHNYLSWWSIELSKLYVLTPVRFVTRLLGAVFLPRVGPTTR